MCSATATALYHLGNLHKKLKRLEEAEDCFRRALLVEERRYGPQSPEVACALNNLASMLKKQARFAESELLYVRALSIRRVLCSGDSPDTANVVFNLGLLFEAKGDLVKAEVRAVGLATPFASCSCALPTSDTACCTVVE